MAKWNMSSSWWRHAHRKEQQLLVAECEAFCLGRFAEHAIETSDIVPAWAWTNLLAHGTVAQLRGEEAACAHRRGSSQDWRGARAYLVTELLEAIERGVSLEDLQTQVLQPLELDLCGQRSVEWWTPGRWVTTVRTVLGTYENSRRH